MKRTLLVTLAVLLAGCCCTRVVQYRQVVATPVVTTTWVTAPAVVQPVIVYPYSQGPVDVSTTTVDYY